MEFKVNAVLRAALLTKYPTCFICGKNACCTVGIQCDYPDHPVEYYGNNILERNYYPKCSYVVSFVDRPDLGSPLWCVNCVSKRQKLFLLNIR